MSRSARAPATPSKRDGQGVALVHGGGLYHGEIVPGPAKDPDGFQPVLKDPKSRAIAEGYGQCSWPDGSHYEGEWHKGLPHGEGSQVFTNGETYMGEWQAGMRHGFGRWCSGEGHEYCGQWRRGQFHGKGQLQLQGGGGYWGSYADGQMHGSGILTWPDGFVMAGSFEMGLRHGNALEVHIDDWVTVRADAIYERDRLVSRQPADVVKNGSVILDTEGRRAGRLVNGRAICFEEGERARNRGVRAQLHDGGLYVGQIRNATLDGRGQVTYWQGTSDESDPIRSYEGLFHDDRRHGIGVGRWDVPPHETIFAGAWERGRPCGPGIMKWPDGSEYKGEFSNGVPHGFGSVRIPGRVSLATGTFGPEAVNMGIFHYGRLYIATDPDDVKRANLRTALAVPPRHAESPTSTHTHAHSSRRMTAAGSSGRGTGPVGAGTSAHIQETDGTNKINLEHTESKVAAPGEWDARRKKMESRAWNQLEEEEPPLWRVDGFPQAHLRLKLGAVKLKKMDMFGQSDPYLVFRRAAVRHSDRAGVSRGASPTRSSIRKPIPRGGSEMEVTGRDGLLINGMAAEKGLVEDPKSVHRGKDARNCWDEVSEEAKRAAIEVAIYRTEVVFKTLSPVWEEVTMLLENLCPSKHPYDDLFTIECWDFDETSDPKLIGKVRTTVLELIRPRPKQTPLQLPLLDENGKGNIGSITVLSAVTDGPINYPPSLLSGESLSRLAYRAESVATAVADMTLWEHGLDHEHGLLSMASVFECIRPQGPPLERPIWRIKAIEDQHALEASGKTMAITMKEELDAFERDFQEEMDADMLSLDPPMPPARLRRKRALRNQGVPRPTHAVLRGENSPGGTGERRIDGETGERQIDADEQAVTGGDEQSAIKKTSDGIVWEEDDIRAEDAREESEGSDWGEDEALGMEVRATRDVAVRDVTSGREGMTEEIQEKEEYRARSEERYSSGKNVESIGDEEAQRAIVANAREADQEEEPLDPRQLVVTIVTARDVPVNTRAPKGGGLYVVVEFEGQAQKTATRLWSENVVLDTSQTFGVTHESRFFDWGEQLTFMLPDMDRIVTEGASDLRVLIKELDPIVEAEQKKQAEERLAVLAFAAEQRRKEAEDDAERARSAKEDQARRKKMSMAEIMAERKEEKEREKRERERLKEEFRAQEERDRVLASQGSHATRPATHLTGVSKTEERSSENEATDQVDPDLVGSGALPADLMTRVVTTVIGWEGEGTVNLYRGQEQVMGVDSSREASIVLRLQILNRLGIVAQFPE